MTIKHYRRRGTFLAVKFTGDNIDELSELCGGRVFFRNKPRPHFVFFDFGTEIMLQEGDYLICDRGEYSIMNEDLFETMFEEAK